MGKGKEEGVVVKEGKEVRRKGRGRGEREERGKGEREEGEGWRTLRGL